MSTLCFFPWLRLAGPATIDHVALLPYSRGTEPFGDTENQRIADEILGTHTDRLDHPVAQATILAIDAADPFKELASGEIAHAFELRELMVTSGLAMREFFSNGGVTYCNSHYFQLVCQKFGVPYHGTAITSRRRDGTNKLFQGKETFQVPMPDHVLPFMGASISLDEPLLRALLTARSLTGFPGIYEAIVGYNLANTDGREMTEQVELVLLNGAFERLFDCQGGKEKQLVENFLRTLSPTKEVAIGDVPRLAGVLARNKRPKFRSVREAWIRDLFQLRGKLAHGRITPAHLPLWTLREHLLLGAYIFPFVIKAVLAKAGMYVVSEDDQAGINAFESLAAVELFAPHGNDGDPGSWPWNIVMEEVRHERLRIALRDLIS